MSKTIFRKRCKIQPQVQFLTTENHTRIIQWHHSDTSRVNPNKGSGPQFGETVYISEVNGARKVISNGQVAMNKNTDPCINF